MSEGVKEDGNEKGGSEDDGGGGLAVGDDGVPVDAVEVSLGGLGGGDDFRIHHVIIEFNALIITGAMALSGSVLTHFGVHSRAESKLNSI